MIVVTRREGCTAHLKPSWDALLATGEGFIQEMTRLGMLPMMVLFKKLHLIHGPWPYRKKENLTRVPEKYKTETNVEDIVVIVSFFAYIYKFREYKWLHKQCIYTSQTEYGKNRFIFTIQFLATSFAIKDTHHPHNSPRSHMSMIGVQVM